MGQAYLKKGEREKGAAYLKKVQELNAALRKKEIDEQEELTLITLGEERLDEGKLAEAESLFERARIVNPKNWHANEYLAKITLYAVIGNVPSRTFQFSKKSISIPSKQTF